MSPKKKLKKTLHSLHDQVLFKNTVLDDCHNIHSYLLPTSQSSDPLFTVATADMTFIWQESGQDVIWSI